jgi:hypothetical protein
MGDAGAFAASWHHNVRKNEYTLEIIQSKELLARSFQLKYGAMGATSARKWRRASCNDNGHCDIRGR